MGDVNWSLGFTLPNPVVRSNDLKIYIYIHLLTNVGRTPVFA